MQGCTRAVLGWSTTVIAVARTAVVCWFFVRRGDISWGERSAVISWREKEREGGTRCFWRSAVISCGERRREKEAPLHLTCERAVRLSLSPQVDAIARLDRAVAEVRNDVAHKDLVS